MKDSDIFKGIENNSHMYFVHSYEFVPEDKSVNSSLFVQQLIIKNNR